MANKIPCQDCGGSGEIEYDGVVGYVTIDMAIDAGDRSLEGQPITGTVREQCETCNGYGWFSPPSDNDDEEVDE